MNPEFFDILAWLALVYSVVMLFAIWGQHNRLNSTIGELEQLMANMKGYRIRPKPAGPYLILFAVSVAWLVSRGF